MSFLIKLMLFIFILIYAIPFALCLPHILILAYKKKRAGEAIVKRKMKRRKKESVLKRLLWDAPRQIVADRAEYDEDVFRQQGLIIFTGKQGQGKTISMVQYIQSLQKDYEKLKVTTNFAYAYEDDVLDDYTKLTEYKNEKFGVVAAIDEMQNWFNSKQSRNFPASMLSVVTQNRKNRRCVLGTAQQFYMLSKDIRTQCTELRKCNTMLNCITVVRCFDVSCDEAGDVKELKFKRMYFFVQSKELRESYDTYKVIENLSRAGFKEKLEVTL